MPGQDSDTDRAFHGLRVGPRAGLSQLSQIGDRLLILKGKERTSKPAVSRVLSRTIIHLGRTSPSASSNLPGSPLGTGGGSCLPAPLFGLAPGGVYRAAACCQSRGALLPHLFTLTRETLAVYFLWHFPWAYTLQALPGALSEGARTFLCLERQRLPGRLRRSLSNCITATAETDVSRSWMKDD